MTPGRVTKYVAWVILVSTALKLVLVPAVAELRPVADERMYITAAISICQTGAPTYPMDEAEAAPAMSYFLAACYGLAGKHGFLTLARIVQVLLSAVTAVLVFHIARRAAGPPAGILATALVAFSPTQIAFTHYFWNETLYTLFSTAAVWLLLTGRSREGPAPWNVAAGVVGGLASLVKSFFVGLAPLFMAWLFLSSRGSYRRRAAAAALFAGGLLLAILPWSIRNTLRFGRFLLISTQAGPVMAISASPIRPNSFDLGLQRDWEQEAERYRQEHGPDYEGVVPFPPRPEAEHFVDRYNEEVRGAIAFMFRHPLLTLKHSRVRLEYMLNPTSYLARHVRTGQYAGLSAWAGETIVALVLASSMLILTFFVLGLFLRPWNRDKALLAMIVLGSFAGHALSQANSRYRLPIEPLMAPFAGDALLRWRDWGALARQRSFWLLGVPALAFLGYVFIEYVPYNYA